MGCFDFFHGPDINRGGRLRNTGRVISPAVKISRSTLWREQEH